jgi:Ca2+-binding RTX toxin-like protein
VLGEAGDDLLLSGGGADILISGRGSDTARGMAGSDILIDGTTVYDGDAGALRQLSALWASDASYRDRIASVVSSDVRLNTDRVFADLDNDELEGNGDLDWFFFLEGDTTDEDGVQERLN